MRVYVAVFPVILHETEVIPEPHHVSASRPGYDVCIGKLLLVTQRTYRRITEKALTSRVPKISGPFPTCRRSDSEFLLFGANSFNGGLKVILGDNNIRANIGPPSSSVCMSEVRQAQCFKSILPVCVTQVKVGLPWQTEPSGEVPGLNRVVVNSERGIQSDS